MEKALGAIAPGGHLPSGAPGLPGLGGGAGFNLPPGFDKFSKK
jgi:signal recognition particle subunit SRP54